MKCRRELNSFELGIGKRVISELPSFRRRNIKEDNENRVKTFYSKMCSEYREDNSIHVFKKQGDVKVQLNGD